MVYCMLDKLKIFVIYYILASIYCLVVGILLCIYATGTDGLTEFLRDEKFIVFSSVGSSAFLIALFLTIGRFQKK